MAATRSRRSLLKAFDQAPEEVREYFEHLPGLIAADDYPLTVALSYAFSQVELAQNMALYCGVVKLHRADATVARGAIDTHHMTRGDFKEKFEVVFGSPFPKRVAAKITAAEKVRDKVMHGKTTTPAQRREALGMGFPVQ